MALDHLVGVKLLISIDFGTTRTGYSFVFTDRVIDDTSGFEYFSKNFNSRHFRNQYKDLSDILLPDGPLDYRNVTLAQGDVLGDSSGRRAFFGFDAFERFHTKRDLDSSKALYFSRYKLDLASGVTNPITTSLIGGDNRSGERCSTVDLVALILRFHGKKALEEALKSSFSSEILDHQIRWGITVPAIWGKAPIELMQSALQIAGLAKDSDDISRRFMFITEPLAATFAVLRDRRELNESLSAGENFVLVDCGGGTIDTSVIGVNDSGEFEIIDFGDGVKQGGSFLNEAIAEKFWRVFPPEARTSLASLGSLEFHSAIEQAKCGYNAINGDDFSVQIGRNLSASLESRYPDAWRAFCESTQYYSPMPEVHDFQLTCDEYQSIESTVYGEIRACLDRVLEKLDRKPEYIFLVGGFSASASLQAFLSENYGKQVKLVVPSRPEKAIVDGALSYILFPERLKLRLQCSYGIEVIEPFNSKHHPRERRIVDASGDEYCSGRFRSFLTKGGRVPIGSRTVMNRRIRIVGVWPSEIDIEEQVFMSSGGDKTYIDEDGVRVVADLKGGSMRVANGVHPSYEVFFEFGALVTIGVTNPDTGRVSKESFSPIINLTKE